MEIKRNNGCCKKFYNICSQLHGHDYLSSDNTLVFYHIVRLCTVFNSFINFIIYCLASRQFRKELKDVIGNLIPGVYITKLKVRIDLVKVGYLTGPGLLVAPAFLLSSGVLSLSFYYIMHEQLC